jgi:hypothetical protein
LYFDWQDWQVIFIVRPLRVASVYLDGALFA